MKSFPLIFRACVYPSPDVKGWLVVHCLELDLIGEGATPKDAIVELIQAIEIQIEACKTNSQLFFPAPAYVWQRYKQGKAKKILKHGSVRGKSLSTKQKGFFGARAGGVKRKKT